MAKEKKTIISVKGLNKKYGSLEVLKGLNLDVIEGETLVILGRSGVGKSVLLRQLIGIEKAESGTVEINGKNLANMSEEELEGTTKSMGMLFQGAALFDSMNVFENIAFYLRQHEPHLSEKEIENRVLQALKMVNLEGAGDKMPSDLSGGMKKRAALARLIVYRPKIILYDEPTTGLDPITGMHINELIKKTQKELNATSIVVTHDIRSALEIGDRLAFHSDGGILHIATKEEFLKIKDEVVQSFLKNAMLTENVLAHLTQRSQ